MLQAWGVRKITLLDNGRVAMSNPLRQSLYTLDDCLNGGEFKATAAVKSLKRIFPAVVIDWALKLFNAKPNDNIFLILAFFYLLFFFQEVEGFVMAIPMPGHPVPSQEEDSVIDDCRRLCDLIDAHDAVFLLTDTRESRWLPSLLCANTSKVAQFNIIDDMYYICHYAVTPHPCITLG